MKSFIWLAIMWLAFIIIFVIFKTPTMNYAITHQLDSSNSSQYMYTLITTFWRFYFIVALLITALTCFKKFKRRKEEN